MYSKIYTVITSPENLVLVLPEPIFCPLRSGKYIAGIENTFTPALFCGAGEGRIVGLYLTMILLYSLYSIYPFYDEKFSRSRINCFAILLFIV
ncbi:MAG: hypothetical protein LUB59_04010 [Candidatus Gastranaerophilales bacterium]|nr:hypothetical protein [Candidatus Gastranaerophilales bacterium]